MARTHPIVLVPSPLLGPAVWAPTCDWLRGSGWPCEVLSVDLVASGASADSVLVPHSNAGYYAPALAVATGACGTVFVDAALALPDASTTSLAPRAFLSFLEELVQPDGLLPPWTEWWDDLGDLFTSAAVRAAVEAEQPRLPLSYFTQQVDVPVGWAAQRCAYLAFGDTYADELSAAESRGWPTRTIDGGHLHQLHDPVAVGGAIVDLIGCL